MNKDNNNIDLNDEFKIALAFINETNKSIFLTGKAGTGKTTFLKYLKANTIKKSAVVAPTGIAAITACGVTVHSLFNLPITPFLSDHSEIRNNLNAEKKVLLRELELLVIDEVSMLRADVLDVVDSILREVRKKPDLVFGGIQVIFIGDLQQLSPIVLSEEWNQLKKIYESPYFISAKVFREANPVIINLQKIYRQNDEVLIELLNAVRQGECDTTQIQLLNKYCQSGLQTKDGFVTLSTHNNTADFINAKKLEEIPGRSTKLAAEIHGDFDEASFPTDNILHIKEGAQVMLIRNDSSAEKRFFNGKIGIIRRIEQERLHIEFDDEQLIEVEREIWRNIKYEYDQQSGKILQHETGSFRQFPIRLAWAITIHKSQGLTFDKAILDIKNVFASGQAYVALSRVKSLEGLILSDVVTKELINCNANIPGNVNEPDMKALMDTLTSSRKEYIKGIITEKFEWLRVQAYIEENQSNFSGYPIIEALHTTVIAWMQISKKFNLEITTLLKSFEPDVYVKINARIQAACSYFVQEVNALLDNVLAKEFNRTKNNINQRLVFRFIKGCIELLKTRRTELELTATIMKGLNESKAITNIFSTSVVQTPETDNVVLVESNTSNLNEIQSAILNHYRNGDSITIISQKTNLNILTVENQLADLVAMGELDILDVIEEAKLREIISIFQADQFVSIFAIKQKVGENVSFGQIKAVLNYRKRIQNKL